MFYTTNDVFSGTDGYIGRFPLDEDPETLFASLVVYCLASPDRTGTGDTQVPWTGSPIGGVFAQRNRDAEAYGPTQFLTADVVLGWYDGRGRVWVMDRAIPESKQAPAGPFGPNEARPGIKPFVAFTDPPQPGENIRLLIDESRLDQPINGIIIRGSGLGARAVFEDHYFLPTGDHKHVSHHRGPHIPTKSTRVHDINSDGDVDPDVWGGFDKLMVVVPQGGGCARGNPDEYTLALNYAGKTGPGYGLAVFEETGGLPLGNTVVPPQLQSVMAYLSYARKGPATAGHPTNDKHKQADTPEGAVNSAHDHGERYVYKNIEMDGPELFEEVYEPPVGEGVIPVRVHKQWKADDTHEGPCGQLPGRWREHTKAMSAPTWDEPAVKDEPARKQEPAAKEDPAPKEGPPGVPQRVPPGERDPAAKGGGDGEDPVYLVFYNPEWDDDLPEVDFEFPGPDDVTRPDSEKPVQDSVASAMSSVVGEWQGLPEIKPGNVGTPSAQPPSDYGPLELRRHSIEYAAVPDIFTKPKLYMPSKPPVPPENMSELGPGDPHREAYLDAVADWYHDNMLKGVTGKTWEQHVNAPVSLHSTAFAKIKGNGFDYNIRAKYKRSRDLSRPRQRVTGTGDGGMVFHPFEIKHWMLPYGYAGDDLPATPSTPEVMFYKGVRLTFAAGLHATNASRGVAGIAIEQDSDDVVTVSGVDTDGTEDTDKRLQFDVMTGLPSYTTTERNALTNMAAGTLIWNSTTSAINQYNGSAWVAVGTGSGDVTASGNIADGNIVEGSDGAKEVVDSGIATADVLRVQSGVPLTASKFVTSPASPGVDNEVESASIGPDDLGDRATQDNTDPVFASRASVVHGTLQDAGDVPLQVLTNDPGKSTSQRVTTREVHGDAQVTDGNTANIVFANVGAANVYRFEVEILVNLASVSKGAPATPDTEAAAIRASGVIMNDTAYEDASDRVVHDSLNTLEILTASPLAISMSSGSLTVAVSTRADVTDTYTYDVHVVLRLLGPIN